MTRWILLAATAATCWGQSQTQAQTDQRKATPFFAEAERQLRNAQLEKAGIVLASVFGGPAIKGAPYSADAVTETLQVLADGNRISNKTSIKQYRDSEGRERREQGTVTITDPAAGSSFTLDPASKTANKSGVFRVATCSPLAGPSCLSSVATGAADQVARLKDELTRVQVSVGKASTELAQKLFINTSGVVTSGNGSTKAESLGKRNIEGVIADGTRAVRTIPAGEIGNERPIEIVSESWYSDELKMIVMSKQSDPRTGETTFRLTNISRAEPARLLFEVPSDYTVTGSNPAVLTAPSIR